MCKSFVFKQSHNGTNKAILTLVKHKHLLCIKKLTEITIKFYWLNLKLKCDSLNKCTVYSLTMTKTKLKIPVKMNTDQNPSLKGRNTEAITQAANPSSAVRIWRTEKSTEMSLDVLQSDETKINLNQSDGKARMWWVMDLLIQTTKTNLWNMVEMVLLGLHGCFWNRLIKICWCSQC